MMHHNHRLTENVKLLQKVALFHEGKVLLLRRSENEVTRPLCWDLPGGNSEWPEVNETLKSLHLADAIREVQEETGIKLQTSDFHPKGDHSLSGKLRNLSFLETHFDHEKQVYSIIFGWKVELDHKPEIILSDEHIEYVWVKISELENYDFGTFVSSGHWIKDVILGKG